MLCRSAGRRQLAGLFRLEALPLHWPSHRVSGEGSRLGPSSLALCPLCPRFLKISQGKGKEEREGCEIKRKGRVSPWRALVTWSRTRAKGRREEVCPGKPKVMAVLGAWEERTDAAFEDAARNPSKVSLQVRLWGNSKCRSRSSRGGGPGKKTRVHPSNPQVAAGGSQKRGCRITHSFIHSLTHSFHGYLFLLKRQAELKH